MSIHIEDLTVRFKNSVTAIDHADLDIPNGIFGLLGENGAGKTTLMRVLTTVLKPTNGMVTLDGILYSEGNYEKIQRKIGYLPQEIELYPNLTVQECLEYMGDLAGVPKAECRKRIDYYLKKTSLIEHRKKKMKQLSGGMKRRVGLVQALLIMTWCIGVYVVLPSFAKAHVVFNYVTWFSILYVIASYIRLYPKECFNSTKITGFLAGVSLLLSWMSIIVLAAFSRMIGKHVGLCYFFVSDSNKILALTTGISGFLFFKNLKIGYSRRINTIAAATFGVLCIHANSDTMRRWLWRDICNNVDAYNDGVIVVHAIAVTLVVFGLCTAIEVFRTKLKEYSKLTRKV